MNPSSGSLSPNNISVDPEQLVVAVSAISVAHPPTVMGRGGEEVRLRDSCALSLEEVIRRRSDRMRRLSKIYRKRYWRLMDEVRFKYREYYWKFGRSGLKAEKEEEVEEEYRVSRDRERRVLHRHENSEYSLPARMHKDGCRFLEGGEVGGLGCVDGMGQDGGGFQDRSGENSFAFFGSGFPASGDGGSLGMTGDNGFGFPERVFPTKMRRNGCGFAEEELRYSESDLPEKMGQDECGLLGGSGDSGFVFTESGFLAKGSQAGYVPVVRTEDDGLGFTKGGFSLGTEKDRCDFMGKPLESGYVFPGSGIHGRVGQGIHGLSAKTGEKEFRVPDGIFPVKTCQEDCIIHAKTGENGAVCPMKRDDSSCGFAGCKLKPMALCTFCHSHVLSDSKQQLYKACSFVIKSHCSGQTGPITCGKPVLRAAVPSLCSVHFQKSQKLVTGSLKKAGLNTSSSSKTAPMFHVIISEYVHYIQTKRRHADHGNQVHKKDLSVKAVDTVKDKVIE